MTFNQGDEHFIFSNEVSYATWAAPTKALPITSFELLSDRTMVIPDTTGYGRGHGIAFQGEKPVTGNLQLLAFSEYMGSLLKAALTSVVSTVQGATSVYRHKLLLDDSSPTSSLSMEKQHGGGSTDAQVARGVKIAKMVFSIKTKEPCRVTLDLVGEDEAWVGGNWEDGTSAPAAATTPVPYPSALNLPFRFDIGQLLYGGTVALTSGELVVTGGSAVAYVEACEITVEMAQDPVFVINSKATAGYMRDQGHIVSIKFDLDWIAADTTYYDYHRAGTESVLQLHFVGTELDPTPYYQEMDITLPRVAPMEAKPPAAAGAKSRRVQSVMYRGLVHTTVDHKFGLVIQNEETTI